MIEGALPGRAWFPTPDDLPGIERSLWAVWIDERNETIVAPTLPEAVLRGGPSSYPRCRTEAGRARSAGATAILAAQAGLRDGCAGGRRVEAGALVEAGGRDGLALALLGPRPALRGFLCGERCRPDGRVLARTRLLASPP